MDERVAIIDLGTNTFHLLIAMIENGKPSILWQEKQPVKLGQGGINQGNITEAATERALQCLRRFKKVLAEQEVHKVRAFGTSALRSAQNGKEVIDRIRTETGIEVELITGDQEAEFIYFGVRSAMDLGVSKSLIVDIGGGSVEFIIANGEAIFWKRSFDIGAQRLLELFHRHDPILPEEIIEIEAHFKKFLVPLEEAVRIHQPVTLVGSSGTFDTLSEIYCVRHDIAYSLLQKETPLAKEEFYKIHSELVSKDRAARLSIPGMIEMRVDMIVAASCLIKYLLDTDNFEKIRVSTYSLKEGVLARWDRGLLG